MQHITYDKNVDEITNTILTKLNNGAEAKTDLEKIVKRLTNTENIIELFLNKIKTIGIIYIR